MLAETLKFIPPLHAEGYRFVLIAFVLTCLGFWFRPVLGYAGLFFLCACALFFRNPHRVVFDRIPGAIVSAADGMVTQIETVKPPACLALTDNEVVRVSTFLSVFDVHANRVPFAGTIVHKEYFPGKFLNASLDKSSEENERQCVTVSDGTVRVAVVQIAGLIARRIVCDVSEGQNVALGSPLGIIRFGSRVDVYIPKNYDIWVRVGQRMVGGETVLALPKDARDV